MQPSLAELQRALAARILARETSNLEAWIHLPPGTDAAARLAVHVHGYPARICESLREAYPALAQILGEGSFAALADRFTRATPAGPRNLNLVGETLPAFLASDRSSADLPFLSALAELEWAASRCFHAELLPAFDASECARWTLEEWGRAKLRFQPGLALVCAPWPLRELRETCRRERSEIDVDLVDRHDNVLIYRREYEVVVESIEDAEAQAVRSLRDRESLGDVAERLADGAADTGCVARFFSRWAFLGLVVSCETESPA